VLLAVYLDDDGFDRGVALDENAWLVSTHPDSTDSQRKETTSDGSRHAGLAAEYTSPLFRDDYSRFG